MLIFNEIVSCFFFGRFDVVLLKMVRLAQLPPLVRSTMIYIITHWNYIKYLYLWIANWVQGHFVLWRCQCRVNLNPIEEAFNMPHKREISLATLIHLGAANLVLQSWTWDFIAANWENDFTSWRVGRHLQPSIPSICVTLSAHISTTPIFMCVVPNTSNIVVNKWIAWC